MHQSDWAQVEIGGCACWVRRTPEGRKAGAPAEVLRPKVPEKGTEPEAYGALRNPARLQKIVLHHTDQSSTSKNTICPRVPCDQIPLFHFQDMGGTTRFQKATCHPMSSGRSSHQRFCVSSISMALATMKPTAPTTCPYVPDE